MASALQLFSSSPRELAPIFDMVPSLQGQAVRWVRNMEASNGVKVISITAPDMMRQVSPTPRLILHQGLI